MEADLQNQMQPPDPWPPLMADSSDQQHTSMKIQQVSGLDELDCVPAERRNCSTSSATTCCALAGLHEDAAMRQAGTFSMFAVHALKSSDTILLLYSVAAFS